jgi:hypothetical protein
MTTKDAIGVYDRLSEKVFKLLCMGFKSGKIFFAWPALVGDDHNAAFRKGSDCREVFPETFVIKNKVGGGINRRVEIKPEEDGFSLASQLPYGSNLHPDHLFFKL